MLHISVVWKNYTIVLWNGAEGYISAEKDEKYCWICTLITYKDKPRDQKSHNMTSYLGFVVNHLFKIG